MNTNTTWTALRTGAALLLTVGAMTLARPASAIERSLAGIKIFSTQASVLKKYGSPSQVIVGRPSLLPTGGLGTSGAGGTTPSPAGGAGPLPGMGGGGGVPSEFGGGAGVASPGLGAPASSSTGTTTDASNGEVTWIYERAGGSDLEFTLSSDGRVVQIRATGYKNGNIKTSKGVTLGQNYGVVIAKYGYPETQTQDTPQVITARYTERVHAAFQFYNQRLVAIIVAAVE